MAKKQEHPNLAKNKKIKFSATMPQHEESEEVRSQDEDVESQSKEESFSGNDSSEDSMEVSESEENSEDSKEEEQSKRKQGKRREEEQKGQRKDDKKIVIKSGGNQDRGEQQDDSGDQSQEGSGSDSGQQQSSYESQAQSSQQSLEPHANPQPQTLLQPQPTQAPLASSAISPNPNPTIQSSQVSSSHHSVPQQQMQTDDFDSGVVNGEEVVGEGQRQGSRIQQEDVKRVNSQQKQVEQNVTVRQDKQDMNIPMHMQVQNVQVDLTKARVKSQEGNSDKGQVPQPIVQQQSKDAKVPESKQAAKSKKLKQAPSKKPSKPQAIPVVQTIQQQQQKIQQQSGNDPTDHSSDQDEDSFYQYIHPYLMLVGSEIVQKYMSKKLQYKPSQASMWATELSSQVLLTTYFDGVGQPQGVDEEQDMQKKQKLMQKAILENEFYRSLHSQMQVLYKQQAIPKLSLGKLYFMIKRYKTIASCIMVQRKPNKQYSLNVSSSGFWNRRKDGQINFTYENKNIYVFLTLYGVQRDKDAGEL